MRHSTPRYGGSCSWSLVSVLGYDTADWCWEDVPFPCSLAPLGVASGPWTSTCTRNTHPSTHIPSKALLATKCSDVVDDPCLTCQWELAYLAFP